MIIISHGLRSSELFFLVNLIYRQTNRLIFINKGMINFIYLQYLYCDLYYVNIESPVSLNLVSEILLI